MNLMRDKWIPVKRRDGTVEDIAPFEVTDKIERNPVVALAAPRPDFNGALIQFLIGLFQTVYAPKNETEWEKRMENPPKPDELQKITEKVAFAFELFGNGPRFMQDMSLDESNRQFGIASLLIDSPGEHTLKLSKDFFIKRHTVARISPRAAAIALFTLQTNSPSGGNGHLVSIRGGGPLTTLVKSEAKNAALWEHIWLNILTKEYFPTKFDDEDWPKIFPWIDNKIGRLWGVGKSATVNLFHPYTVYWACPRRIQLLAETAQDFCDLTNETTDTIVRGYYTKTYGLNYSKGGWIHPLSPYYMNKDMLLPLHPQPGGFLYDNWTSFALDRNSKGKMAQVVSAFYGRKSQEMQSVIHAFGYDMDNMKARCWYEAEIPLFQIAEKDFVAFEEQVAQVLAAAELVKRNLRQAVTLAWFDENQSVKGDFGAIETAFLKNTENNFFDLIQKILKRLQSGRKDFLDLKAAWLKRLNTAALALFDSTTEAGSVEFENIERIVHARKNLIMFNFGAVTKKALGLPVPEKIEKRSKQKA
ncbi:MAG TPA: type I-E CRISPR-associated protein Cse1/CasA [Turneriella sp.]|nr:type I-E CRISPR-associated protein Cse1/CasA [Turneriella sp.]